MDRNDNDGRLVDDFGLVTLGLLGELLLDFAHLGKSEDPADTGRIDAVLGRQDDRHEDCGSGGNGNDRGSQQLRGRSEEHTSELQSLMRISYAVFCLKKK